MLASLTRNGSKKFWSTTRSLAFAPGGPPEGQKGEANQIAGRAPLD